MSGREPLGLPDGRVVIPDNRWDLVRWDLEPAARVTPSVSVVIPYYNQPRQLALVLEALTVQTYSRAQLEVIVADDGSAEPPAVELFSSKLTVSVVRQADDGFRAAAARNLGAAASTGDVLCFLDADTIPCPDYIERASRLPAAVPDALVVGRRRHADLSAVDPAALRRWLADAAGTEPQWLVDGYRRTKNLLEPGWDGYKYILSAVLTCTREFFYTVGGFDESFVRYGGEDWEFANRAFMMGAVIAHEPRALAWHDGPDWAERSVLGRTDAKNAEALALAPLITDPAARTSGLRYRVPDNVVLVKTSGHTAASLSVTLASVVSSSDAAAWLVGEDAEEMYDALALCDSRVRTGFPDAGLLSRCRFVTEVSGRVEFANGALDRIAEHVAPGGVGMVVIDFGTDPASVTLRSSRAAHRARRWSSVTEKSEHELVETLFGVRTLPAADTGFTVAAEEPWLSW